MKRDRLLLIGVCAVALAAFALRMFRLGAQDLWGDEAFTAWLAQRPISSILRDLAQGEPHPPLYPLALWAWVKAVGHGEFALRLPSALFGTALVPMFAVIGWRLRGRHLALVAAILAAINPFLVWYSQEARMYIVVAFFAAWSAAALLRHQPRWIEFAAASALMIYTHYYGLLALAGFALWILLGIASRRLPARAPLAALGAIALAYVPWVAYASRIFFSYYGVAPGNANLLPVFSAFWLRSFTGLAIDQPDAQRWVPLFVILAAVGLFACTRTASTTAAHSGFIDPGGPTSTSLHRQGEPAVPASSIHQTVLLVCMLFVPLLGGLAVSLVRPMYAERYLIVSVVPLLILIGCGIVYLRRLRAVEALALVLILAAVVVPLRNQFTEARYVKSEYSRHTAELTGLASPNDGVILDGASQGFLFDYYYDGSLPHYPLPRDVPMSEPATGEELSQLAARHSGLWAFLYATHDYDPGDFVEKWLSQHAFRAWHTWTINGRLVYYATYPQQELLPQSGTARFGESLELRQFATRLQPYAAGQVIPLLFRWHAANQMDKDLKLSLRLRDSDGFLWGQTDVEPVSGFRPTRTWRAGEDVEDRVGILIDPGTPPGTYTLELRVYPVGGAVLPAQATGLAASGPVLTLGQVTVDRAGHQPTGALIPAYHQVAATFADQIVLEGESGMGEVTAGENAYLTVLWRALHPMATNYEALLQLVDRQGRVGFETVARPNNGAYSQSEWKEGEVVRWQYNLRVGPRTPPGDYRLLLSLRPPGGQALPVRGQAVSGNAVVLQKMLVKSRPKRTATSEPQFKVGTVLGGKISLRGYSLSPSAPVPGGKLNLTLYWESVAESEVSYTVFTHLLDGGQRIWAQHDTVPCDGGCPTTTWLPGDVIEDRYDLAIKPEAAAGEYDIEVGMYDAVTGRRLATAEGTDRIPLPKIRLNR